MVIYIALHGSGPRHLWDCLLQLFLPFLYVQAGLACFFFDQYNYSMVSLVSSIVQSFFITVVCNSLYAAEFLATVWSKKSVKETVPFWNTCDNQERRHFLHQFSSVLNYQYQLVEEERSSHWSYIIGCHKTWLFLPPHPHMFNIHIKPLREVICQHDI